MTTPPDRSTGPTASPGYSSAPPGDYYFRSPPPENPPGAKKRRWLWWLIGGIVAFLLFWCLVILAVFTLLRATAGPQSATRGYISAVQAHNWNAAYGYLDTSLRATMQPADIEVLWLQREKADGPINHFTICCGGVTKHFGSADTGNASITLTYNNGTSATRFSMLVKEDGAWKLSRLP